MAVVYLGLGSNLGDRRAYLARAVEELRACGVVIIKMSTIIETKPVGGPVQDDYLNAVIKCETSLPPQELLITLKKIESKLGRIQNELNGPRVIDLDILLYDQISLSSDDLTIPHPRMHTRDFVMIPLTEIEPNLFRKNH